MLDPRWFITNCSAVFIQKQLDGKLRIALQDVLDMQRVPVCTLRIHIKSMYLAGDGSTVTGIHIINCILIAQAVLLYNYNEKYIIWTPLLCFFQCDLERSWLIQIVYIIYYGQNANMNVWTGSFITKNVNKDLSDSGCRKIWLIVFNCILMMVSHSHIYH